jgi:alkylhydroperoxidase/carboxymuconolactone decarboxylase family protein YurZ
MEIGLAELAAVAETALTQSEDGPALSALEEALIGLGVAVSVTSLDRVAIDSAIDTALAAGASLAQVQEVASLISGLGVHSLMVSANRIITIARERGIAVPEDLDAEQQSLWDTHVGGDPFWLDFDRQMPGFLDAMLRLSPQQFVAFFDYCAIPWKSGQVRGRLKELIAMASDATPTHRFAPGFRVHLGNAIKLGVGRLAVRRALAIAAAAPPHSGTP